MCGWIYGSYTVLEDEPVRQTAAECASAHNGHADAAHNLATLNLDGQSYELRICGVGQDAFFEWINEGGDPGSAGPRDFALAAEAGFESAVTTRPGHLLPEHAGHLHALPRVSLNGLHQNEAALRALLSGLPFWLRSRGRKLDVA